MKSKKEMYVTCIVLLAISLFGIFFLSLGSTSLTSLVILEEIPNNFEFVEPAVLDRDSALEALFIAEGDVQEMVDLNLSLFYVSDVLLEAKRAYIGQDTNLILIDLDTRENKAYFESLLVIYSETPTYERLDLNYTEVIKFTQLIGYRKEQAFRIMDMISLIEEKEIAYSSEGVNTTRGVELLVKGKESFENELYDESEVYLEEADFELERARTEQLRIRELLRLSKNFILRYWWQILIVLIVLGLIAKPVVMKIRKNITQRKLIFLRKELKSLNDLIKKAQVDRFVKKRITGDTYNIRVKRYKDKINEIKRTIPVLENIVYGKVRKKSSKKRGVLEVKK